MQSYPFQSLRSVAEAATAIVQKLVNVQPVQGNLMLSYDYWVYWEKVCLYALNISDDMVEGGSGIPNTDFYTWCVHLLLTLLPLPPPHIVLLFIFPFYSSLPRSSA